MLSKFGPLTLMGAGIFTAIGHPITLAAVSYATFKVGKSIYKRSTKRSKFLLDVEEDDLFI
jgi:uncharacterized protein (DUF2062 family)|tara:strand:- start:1332 stop:1514 length:183 start_codon:yes stop_codon:yes gene_type:complete